MPPETTKIDPGVAGVVCWMPSNPVSVGYTPNPHAPPVEDSEESAVPGICVVDNDSDEVAALRTRCKNLEAEVEEMRAKLDAAYLNNDKHTIEGYFR